VDIVRWSPNITEFVTNALAPVKPRAFELDEANKRMRVLVPEE
jgi:N utilization substance protein A